MTHIRHVSLSASPSAKELFDPAMNRRADAFVSFSVVIVTVAFVHRRLHE